MTRLRTLSLPGLYHLLSLSLRPLTTFHSNVYIRQSHLTAGSSTFRLTNSTCDRAQEVLKHADAMKQYQEDVENLNEVAHNRPRAQLVLGIQQENRHIRTLQQENKELRAALEEHQVMAEESWSWMLISLFCRTLWS